MKAIPTIVDSIIDSHSVGVDRTVLRVRPPDSLAVAVALIAYLTLTIAGILVSFLVIEHTAGLIDEGSLLLFLVLLGGTALVLAVPTLVRELLSRLLRRIDY
ncbi:MAG: hypothetical protein IH933_08680 [Euryarchaeota archaeon]|jgi:hypothetical protein|nr:hypothetical protein [Euryarchaeota archaeon]